MLSIRQVSKSYAAVRALDGIDLSLRKGEIVALLGPNGAGKTTLVSIVAGLRRPDAGSVLVGGIDVQKDPAGTRSFIGFAPQALAVYPPLSVWNNLVYSGELAGMHGPELNRRIDQVASALDLTPLLSCAAGTLSGGQKRRLHVALALIDQKPLLLLDEPTEGADLQTRARVVATIKRLAGEGCAVLYSTHQMRDVEQLGARVVILDNGRTVASGLPAELGAMYSTDGVAPSLESIYLAVTGRRYASAHRDDI